MRGEYERKENKDISSVCVYTHTSIFITKQGRNVTLLILFVTGHVTVAGINSIT